MTTRPPEIEWYAASADIVRMGPYASQVEAWEALRATITGHRMPVHTRGTPWEALPRTAAIRRGPVHVPGAYVWPESVEENGDE